MGFKFQSPDKEEVDIFTLDLLNIFSEKDENGYPIGTIYNPLVFEKYFEDQILDLIKVYNYRIPELNGIRSFFKKMNERDLFIILYNVEFSNEISLYISTHLEAWKNKEKPEKLWKRSIEIYGKTLSNYKVKTIGDSRFTIGNPKKTERVCRFCKLSTPEVSFKKKAHAISEALGNKNVILYDECDQCNEKFGKQVERDIILYLSLFRTIYGILGKGGKKKIKSKSFEVYKGEDNTIQLRFYSFEDRPKKGEPYNLTLDFGKEIVLQNIYKSLTKFFLSIIDESELPYFEDTIKWITGKISTNKLPSIYESINYETFTKHPKLKYYLRKPNEIDMPYAVCQFFFTCKEFIFIIPFCNKDSEHFDQNADWESIFKNFSHLNKYQKQKCYDHSDNTPKNFIMNLNTNMITEE